MRDYLLFSHLYVLFATLWAVAPTKLLRQGILRARKLEARVAISLNISGQTLNRGGQLCGTVRVRNLGLGIRCALISRNTG